MTRLAMSAGLACVLLSSPAWASPQGGDPRLATPAGMHPFDWSDTGVYPVIATPGRITDIVLEPGRPWSDRARSPRATPLAG
ncbi:hypothetical protein ACRAWD_11200 [Caulobacter segnis]